MLIPYDLLYPLILPSHIFLPNKYVFLVLHGSPHLICTHPDHVCMEEFTVPPIHPSLIFLPNKCVFLVSYGSPHLIRTHPDHVCMEEFTVPSPNLTCTFLAKFDH
jgi:hypothetical protein